MTRNWGKAVVAGLVGTVVMTGGSLIGHLAYGAVVGAIYGQPEAV